MDAFQRLFESIVSEGLVGAVMVPVSLIALTIVFSIGVHTFKKSKLLCTLCCLGMWGSIGSLVILVLYVCTVPSPY